METTEEGGEGLSANWRSQKCSKMGDKARSKNCYKTGCWTL